MNIAFSVFDFVMAPIFAVFGFLALRDKAFSRGIFWLLLSFAYLVVGFLWMIL